MPTKLLEGLPHISLENQWLQRSWCTVDGLATTRYRIRPYADGPWLDVLYFFDWWPFEALVTVNGHEMPVTRHQPVEAASNISGAFVLEKVCRNEDELSQRIDFALAPREGFPPLHATLHFELRHDEPLLRSWLSLRNNGLEPLHIEAVALEAIYKTRLECEYMLSSKEACLGDDERFVQFSVPRTIAQYQRTLAPGQNLESFSLMTAVCASNSRARSVARHDLIHAFAPQTRHPKIYQQAIGWQGPADLKQSVDEAAEVGIEVLAFFSIEGVSLGDLELNPDLFPNGEEDVRGLCRYARGRGVEIGFYVGECIAPVGSRVQREHPEWQFLGANDSRYDPAAIGNMCTVTGWGDYFRRKVDWLLDMGVTALQTDGPPYSQLCLDESHGHQSPETSKLDNWQWERDFNRDMARRGIFVQSPTGPSVLFDGVSQISGGYTEDDQAVLVGLDQVTQFRAGLSAHTEQLPPSCRWGFFLIGSIFDRPGMVTDPENELVSLEHGLAGHLGSGFSSCLHGTHLFNGPRSKAIVERWIGFYKTYRHNLTCRTIVLRAPDSRGLDAVFHCNPRSNPCAVVVVFNPTERELSGSFLLPLEFAGWERGRTARVTFGTAAGTRDIKVDDQGQALLEVTLAGRAVEWWEINWL